MKLLITFNTDATTPYTRHGRLLYMARIAQGKSREQLARSIGCHRETVRLWETGHRPVDAVMLGRLAEALDQEVELLTGVISAEDASIYQQMDRQGLRQFWQLKNGDRFSVVGGSTHLLEKQETGKFQARIVGSYELVPVAPLTIVLPHANSA